MPDISMCANNKCILRMGCFRYRAEPNPFRQSYSSFPSTEVEGVAAECDWFWPVKEATTKLKSIEIMKNQESKQDPDKI